MKNFIIITLLLIAAGARAQSLTREQVIKRLNTILPMGEEIRFNGSTSVDNNQCVIAIKNAAHQFQLEGSLIIGDQVFPSKFFEIDFSNEIFEILDFYKDRHNFVVKFLRKKDQAFNYIQFGILHIKTNQNAVEAISLKVKRNTILAPFKILNCVFP